MNVDRSASGRTRMLKAKTLAVYHNRNSTKNDYGGEKPSSALTLLLRGIGLLIFQGFSSPCDNLCDNSWHSLGKNEGTQGAHGGVPPSLESRCCFKFMR